MLSWKLFETSAIVALGCATTPSLAQDQAALFDFSIGAIELDDALVKVGQLTGRRVIVASDAAEGLQAKPLTGPYTADGAIRFLLSDTGLAADFGPNVVIVRKSQSTTGPGERAVDSEIIVTGSRIRGARQTSPLVSTSREQILAAGQSDMGEVARSIPQNFGGGQNPGVGTGAESFGSENVNSATTLDLRGLGADATLTLLNGRRLAYNAVSEGVDISAVPVSAVERLEVLPDGASALYGSDAVAGVANIILRRDLNGIEGRARLAAASEGGYVQDQYELTGGHRWSSGGVIASASFNRNTAVRAGQRSFGQALDPSVTLYPRVRHIAGVVSGHQQVGPGIELGLDALYSVRDSFSATANTNAASFLENGATRAPETLSYFFSPVARFDIGDWSATASATHGRDVTTLDTRYFSGGAETLRFTGRYRNRSQSAELGGEGPLFQLPGGSVRLAVGAGYRSIHLAANQMSGANSQFRVREGRDNLFAYGELNVPLFGSENRRPGLARLEFSAAGRFEHYPSLGDVFTPKLSAIYSPIDGFDLRGSWGRSFKAPTLFQQYQSQTALLFPARLFGGDPGNATATAVYLYGGNRALEPQTATNWSVGFSVRPRMPGDLNVEASFFQTRYQDRIVAPIISAARALTDPSIADLVDFQPSQAALTAAITGSDGGFVNYSGRSYDPAQVAAIIDNRNLNVAEQRVRGIDLLASWGFDVGSGARLVVSGNGTWLDSQRRLSAGQPLVDLAGTVFNPPSFRGRAGASLIAGQVNGAVFINRTGGLEDRRFGGSDPISGQTTIDLTLAYRAEAGRLDGLSVQLIALNVLNSKPDRIRTAAIFQTPYDSANFSPIGRLLGFAVGWKW